MSMAFLKKLRLSATFGFVGATRIGIDAVNKIFEVATGPLRRKWNAAIGDAPWLVIIMISMAVQHVPSFGVPALQPWVSPDTRRVLEEQRIRSEVQQGRDPHPYLVHREMTYGARHSNQESLGTNVPRESVPECAILDRFRERQKQIYSAEKHELDARIAELEGIAEADYVTKWLRTGITPS